MLETVLRHGLVDVVPAKAGKLLEGTPEALRRSPRKSLIAAIALVAAARHETDPFANPVFRKLALDAKGDPRIPALALSVWIEVVGMSGSPPDFRVTHAGLPALWDHAVARKEQDMALLLDISGTLAFLGLLDPQTKEFFLWFAERPGLTPLQRVEAASRLATRLGMPEKGEWLLEGVSDDVEGYDVPGVRTSLAVSHLNVNGYDAESARRVMAELFDEAGYGHHDYNSFDFGYRDALEHAGARNELRELGAEYLRHERFAEASDFYLRAGDRDRARQIALAAPGTSADPVIALYRTGAIEDALKTGRLTGVNRYKNAERAGEKKDPQWVIDEKWTFVELMASEAAHSHDRDFQQRAYDGLVRSCGKSLADCSQGTLRSVAEVAAGMGDEARMKEALAAAARQLDREKDSAWSAIYIAGPWAHCEELLRAAESASRIH